MARCVSDGPFLSALAEKRFQPRFLSHMRKKAPLTVERKNSQGGVASEQTPHPSSCPPQAADRRRPFRCSSFSHTNRCAGFAWEPCPLCNPLKTTKEEVIPLPWKHHPSEYRRWRKCSRRNRNYTFVGADAHIGPYESQKIAHPANSIRQIFNGRKQSDLYGVSCARETRSYGRPKGVQTTETKR